MLVHSKVKAGKCLKHRVSRNDTLASLALKYGVTVEVLKRENKLWNNDMLFLREFILVPITPGNEGIADPESVITVTDRERSGSGLTNGSHSNFTEVSLEADSHSVQAGAAAAGGVESAAKTDNPLDFLNKYDSSIAKLKSDVAKMKTNAEFIHRMDNHNPLQFMSRKGSTGSQSSRRTVSLEETVPDSPVLVIRSRTQARVVQDSLEKIERANDDLFEL